MFIGQFNYNIDDKGRITLPTAYRNKYEDMVVAVKGLETCIYIYSLSEWEKLASKIADLAFTKKNNREFSRIFLSGAYEAEIDTKGRINLDTLLIEHAKLNKECVIIGAGNRVEIWDKSIWQDYYNEREQQIEEISEDLDL